MDLITCEEVASSPIDIMSKVIMSYLTIDRNRAISNFNRRYSLKYTLSKYDGDANIDFNSLKSDIKSDIYSLLEDFFDDITVDVNINIDGNNYSITFDIQVIDNGYPYNLNRVADILNGQLKISDEHLIVLENNIRRYR